MYSIIRWSNSGSDDDGTGDESHRLRQNWYPGSRHGSDRCLGRSAGIACKNFYKSMTTHANYRVWQDVYHGPYNGAALYIKFQRAGDYFALWFRSRNCDIASKWSDQSCDLCGAGTLHDGIKTITQKYKGQVFSSETHGAFCDHCSDGFVEFDEAEEAVWLVFCDRVDAAEAAELARNLRPCRDRCMGMRMP